MKRIITWEPGHDCIRFECINNSERCRPGTGGSHGVHGLQIRFMLVGEKGAVQFVLFTGWLPEPERRGEPPSILDQAFPADLGYHAREPQYDGQQRQPCVFLDGAECYYDGSGFNANDAFRALCNAGEEALWEFLAGYYRCVFEGGDYPDVPAYRKPRRGEV